MLTGANGAGKTNVLEAVSLLAPGRGLRRAPYDALARIGGGGSWAVAATATGPDGAADLGTGPDPAGGGRIARIDQDGAALQALADHVRLLWLTPANDGLFTGPAGDRRRFLDRLVLTLDPAHAARVGAFDKLMRQRNKLLEDPHPDARWLDAVETDLAEHATALAAGRRQAVDRLALEAGQDRSGGSSAFPFLTIRLDGGLEQALDSAPAIEVEASYADSLAKSRRLDAAAGRTLEGPHRSDFAVEHGPKGVPAPLCSTGEQKALLIGLILAHARIVAREADGYAPILLLDEIAAHLDDIRRAALYEEIGRLGAQAWLTGTDRALFQPIAGTAQCFDVTDGALIDW